MGAGIRARAQGLTETLAEIAKETEALLPEVLKVWAEEALPFVKDKWPVKSGKSKESIRVSVQLGNVYIEIPEKYASQIHLKGETGPTWRTRLVDNINQNQAEISARTTERLRRGGE